jgi:hypothetical protein
MKKTVLRARIPNNRPDSVVIQTPLHQINNKMTTLLSKWASGTPSEMIRPLTRPKRKRSLAKRV